MARLQIDAEPRTLTGRKVSRIRLSGLVPVVVYGKNDSPTNLQVAARALERVLHHGGLSQLVDVNVQGGAVHNVLIREVQRDPVSHHYLHADFYAVSMTEKQRVEVPLIGVGKPTALAAGLMVLQGLDMVEIEALPADIPANVEVDITDLSLEHPITIAEIREIPGVTILGHAEDHVFSMITTRAGEAAETEAAEEAVAEPEVVARGRRDEEGGEG